MSTVANGGYVSPLFDVVSGNLVGIEAGTGQTITMQAGASSAVFRNSGNLNVQTSATGVSPGATGADNVIAVYSVPANFFSVAGNELVTTAYGSFAANGDTKTIKVYWNPSAAVVGSTVSGGTVVANTGALTTSGGQWNVLSKIVKTGATGSNTQVAMSGGNSTLAPVTNLTAVESGAILVAVTANCATATTDVVFNMLQVEGYN